MKDIVDVLIGTSTLALFANIVFTNAYVLVICLIVLITSIMTRICIND